MRRRTPEERYKFNIRKQQGQLEDFAEHETEWADLLMLFYRLKKIEIPDDEYRACAFFANKEFLRKPGSLTLLHGVYVKCNKELPEVTKETAFDCLRRVRSTLRQIPYQNSNPCVADNSAVPLPYVRRNT